MSYYDTLDEDLDRAKEILLKGDAGTPLRLALGRDLTDEERKTHSGGHIYGADTYAAYKLLESFVETIDQLRKQNDLLGAGAEDSAKAIDAIVTEANAYKREAEAHITAVEQESDAAGHGWGEALALNKILQDQLAEQRVQLREAETRLAELGFAVGLVAKPIVDYVIATCRAHGKWEDK